MLFINLGPKARDFGSLTEEERNGIVAGYRAFNETRGVTPGNQLQPPESATTVRRQGGKTLTAAGPLFDAIDGYAIVEADDPDAAIEVAAQLPGLDLGGAVEVRPLL